MCVSLFHFMRSATMLVLYFIIPKVDAYNFKKPLLTGFGTFIVSQLLLINIPAKGYAF